MIATLPREILLPRRVEFPAWVRNLGEPLKMFGHGAFGKPFAQPMGGAGVAAEPLLLDTVTDAHAAYSLRKLRNDYSGSAVRVRRSSDDAEQDIGFSGTDFDTASFSSFIGGGSGFVKTWYDQSGNARDFTQSTTTAQPLLALNVQNSKPAVVSDGMSDGFVRASYGAVSAVSLFVALRIVSWSGTESTIFDNGLGFTLLSNKFFFYDGGFMFSTNNFATATPYLWNCEYLSGANGKKMYLNGTLQDQATGGAGWGNGTARFMALQDLNARWTNIQYLDMVIYPSVPSTANRQAIESNLNSYYAMY